LVAQKADLLVKAVGLYQCHLLGFSWFLWNLLLRYLVLIAYYRFLIKWEENLEIGAPIRRFFRREFQVFVIKSTAKASDEKPLSRMPLGTKP
jgi:hypothetical protein